MRLVGTDAAKFLQGYLTCDIDALDATHALHGAYCNIKGRVVADATLSIRAGALAVTRKSGGAINYPKADFVFLAADFVFLDRAQHSAGKDLLSSVAGGDLPGAIDIYERILSFDYHYKDVAACVERAKAAHRKPQEDSVPPQTAPAVSTTHKRYEIVRELGRGGMGVVYLARDSVLEREVAYKVLPEGLRGNANALKNFLREAKAAAQLNHANIVTVYDAGESEHGFYMAMELVEGTTLKEILRQRGAVSANAATYIMRQMAAALAYAHGRKVVHRDIKTANTMWTTEKHVKIMDFGLAKLMEEVRNATTMISGTPFYMSPEQTLGRDVDHRTDLYSLGVTMFELATGELPFQKGNVPYHHVHTAPPDPRSVKADLPEGLAAIILRCLQKSPEERFQSAKELLEELERSQPRNGG
jgi:predicted Ser/Thr protein kinase